MTPRSAIVALLLLSACGMGSPTATLEEQSVSHESSDAPDGAVDEGTVAAKAEGEALVKKWVDTACRLYVAEDCTATHEASCGTRAAFQDMATCQAALNDNAAMCTGLPLSFASKKDVVERCIAQVSSYTCGGADAFCDPQGLKPDQRGDCVQVQSMIAACDIRDTGL